MNTTMTYKICLNCRHEWFTHYAGVARCDRDDGCMKFIPTKVTRRPRDIYGYSLIEGNDL